MRRATPLQDIQIRKAKIPPKGKVSRLYDLNGLFITITDTGTKTWYYSYTHPITGKRNQSYRIGKYPALSLLDAREINSQLATLVAKGIDPKAFKREQQKAQLEATQLENGTSMLLFENIALAWFEHTAKQKQWGEAHLKDVQGQMRRYVLPAFQGRRIDGIKAHEIAESIKGLAVRIPNTAADTLSTMKRIFRYAVMMGHLSADPASSLVDLVRLPATKPMQHTSKEDELGALLLAMERCAALLPAVNAYLRTLPYTACRPSEWRTAKWAWLHGDCLHFPEESKKNREAHVIPLPKQVLTVLESLRVHTGQSAFIFANPKTGQPFSENTAGKLMRKQGINQQSTLHGFRHTFSTIQHANNQESLHVEAQLSHKDKNTIRGTYNHAQYLDQRRQMMQAYADYLDALKSQAQSKESQSALQDKP